MSILAQTLPPAPVPCSATTPIASISLAERAVYLLEYGQDVVARLASVDRHVAQYLQAQLVRFASHLRLMLDCQDQSLLRLFIASLDASLAPGEWLLREVAP